ncbi:EAL domain-containing protein [Marinicrinis sediminis]|uniref:EAL domain-containing protein n=1 Tax=Marinicrinis sediminis TaxID=1652465 RepID=A0ABW5RD24_9BACL
MEACFACMPPQPLQEQGTIHFRITDPLVRASFENWTGHTETSWHYQDFQQLSTYIHTLRQQIPVEYGELIEAAITEESQLSWTIPFQPMNRLAARFEEHDLLSIIEKRQFRSHMQAIYNQEKHIFGFEFLLRPTEGGPDFRPNELFDAAKRAGLQSFLDREARLSAIAASAFHLPRGIKRFINFLPSSIYDPNHCLNHTFRAIQHYKLDPQDFIFEVVETEKIEDLAHLKAIFETYKEHGMKVAMDDVGTGYASTEVLLQLKPDIIKIDRTLIDHCDQRTEKQELIQELVDISSSIGAQVLAEGIERVEEHRWCKQAGISLFQGYLFGKPAPFPF